MCCINLCIHRKIILHATLNGCQELNQIGMEVRCPVLRLQFWCCSASEFHKCFLLPVLYPTRTETACFHRSQSEPKRPPFETVRPAAPTQATQPSRTGRAAVRHLQSIAGSARRAGAPSRADVHGLEDTFPDSSVHAMYQSGDQRQQEELSDFEAEEARAVHDSASRAQHERATSRPSSRPSSRRASLRAENDEVRECRNQFSCTA